MKKHKVDWAAYDLALKQRGSITFWFSQEAIAAWKAVPTGKRGKQQSYSDLAIETALSLRVRTYPAIAGSLSNL
jgi:heme-degrading monooxygenase HmoA